MAETTDGAMHFEASLDNRKLLGAIEETIRRINGLSDATVKGGAAMDASFSQMAAEIKQRFDRIDSAVEDHMARVKDLKREYEALGRTNVTGADKYAVTDRKMEISKEIAGHEKALSVLNKEIMSLDAAEKKLHKLQEKAQKNAEIQNRFSVQVRQTEEALRKMSQEGMQGSTAYTAMQEKLVALKSTMKDVTDQTRILASSDGMFQGVISGISGMGGALSATTGAISLFAGENDHLQQVMAKVQSAMALAIGTQQVAQTLNKNSAFQLTTMKGIREWWAAAVAKATAAEVRETAATAANTAAKRAQTAATTGGIAAKATDAAATSGQAAAATAGTAANWSLAVAFRAVGNAIKTIPVFGWIATGISALIPIISMLGDKAEQLAKRTKKLIETQAESNEICVKSGHEVDSYIRKLDRFNGTKEQEKRICEELNGKYGEAVGYYDSVAQWKDVLIQKGGQMIQMLMLEAKAQATLNEQAAAYVALERIRRTDASEQEGAIGSKKNWLLLTPVMYGLDRLLGGSEKYDKYNKNKNVKKAEDDLNFWKQSSEKAWKEFEDFKEKNGIGDFIAPVKSTKRGRKKVEDPFAEMLEDRKKKYTEYFKWLDAGYEKEAQTHFAGLLKSGNTYKEYLQKLIDAGNLSQRQMYQVTKALAEETNTTVTEAFKKSLSEQLSKANSVVEQMGIVKKMREDLAVSDDLLKAKKEEILKETDDQLQEKRRKEIKEVIKNSVSVYDQRIALHKKYLDDIEVLEGKLCEATSDADREYLDRSMEYRKKKYNEDAAALSKATADARIKEIEMRRDTKLLEISNKDYLWNSDRKKEQLETEKKAAQEVLGVYRQIQDATPTDEIAQTIAGITLEIERMNAELEKLKREKFLEVLSGLQKVSSALGNLEGEVGEVFTALSEQIGNISTAYDKTANITDRVSAGISGIVSMINVATSAAAKRDRVEKEYYKNQIALAHEYALALNETYRTQAEMSESGFVKDYAGRISDGFKALSDSTTKYKEAIQELAKGQAKTGLKNVIDWGSVGKGAAAGVASAVGGAAAIGAAIGTVVGPVGTAIGAAAGAIIGGLIGLFKGKTKKNEYSALTEVFPQLVDGAGNLNKELAQTIIKTDQVDEKTKQIIQNALDWAEATEKANKQIKEVVVELAGDLGGGIRKALDDAFRAGEDASKRMFDAASKSLENFIDKLLFSAIFSDVIKQFEKDVAKSLSPDGDGDVLDDYDRLMKGVLERKPLHDKSKKAIKERAKEYGFNMWENTDDNKTLTGAVKGVTEQTASVVAGQLNAMRMVQKETAAQMTTVLFHLSGIDRHTAETAENTRYLRAIHDRLMRQSASDPLRAQGRA